MEHYFTDLLIRYDQTLVCWLRARIYSQTPKKLFKIQFDTYFQHQ